MFVKGGDTALGVVVISAPVVVVVVVVDVVASAGGVVVAIVVSDAIGLDVVRLKLLWHMMPLSAGSICQTMSAMIGQVQALAKEEKRKNIAHQGWQLWIY